MTTTFLRERVLEPVEKMGGGGRDNVVDNEAFSWQIPLALFRVVSSVNDITAEVSLGLPVPHACGHFPSCHKSCVLFSADRHRSDIPLLFSLPLGRISCIQ